MRNLVFAIVFFTLPIWAPAETLTLRQASQVLLDNNPQLAQVRNETGIARNQLRSSYGSYLPQVDFLQGWNRSNNPVQVFGTLLNQGRFTEANFAIGPLNDPGPISDHTSRFQLSWLLYDFGARENRIDVAKSNYTIAQYNLDARRAALFQEMIRRYYALALSAQRVETADAALETARVRLAQAAERVKQGFAVQSDELAARVSVARQEQERIDALQERKIARSALAELLGAELASDFKTAALIERNFPQLPLDNWVSDMENNRPEWKIAREGKNIAEDQEDLQRSKFLPMLQGWSAYEWHGRSLSYSANNWSAGIELRWNLFRGLSDAWERSSAQIQTRNAAQKEREVRNQLELQVETAFYTYISARERCKVARQAETLALESKRIYSERYDSGLVTILDSLQADDVYTQARLTLSRCLYDLHTSYAALLFAAGKGDEIPNLEDYK